MKGTFLDTNLWVYLFSGGEKGVIATEVLRKSFSNIILSSQILGELYNVLTKKKLKSLVDSKEIICRLTADYRVIPITGENVIRATNIATRYKLSYWDSLVITSALEANCEVLYTEDLQHGQVFEKTLKIVNPFIK